MTDPAALLVEALLRLYNWAGEILTALLMDTVFKNNPDAESAAKALGAAFNMLVNLTAFYIALKIFTRFERIILYVIAAGWAIFVAVMLGLLSPDVASRIAEIFS